LRAEDPAARPTTRGSRASRAARPSGAASRDVGAPRNGGPRSPSASCPSARACARSRVCAGTRTDSLWSHCHDDLTAVEMAPRTEGPAATGRFADLAMTFLKEEYADSPVGASSLGLTEYDEKLDDLSKAAFERRVADDTRWLRTFRGIPDDGLGAAAI